jgi:hypothetical protein
MELNESTKLIEIARKIIELDDVVCEKTEYSSTHSNLVNFREQPEEPRLIHPLKLIIGSSLEDVLDYDFDYPKLIIDINKQTVSKVKMKFYFEKTPPVSVVRNFIVKSSTIPVKVKYNHLFKFFSPYKNALLQYSERIPTYSISCGSLYYDIDEKIFNELYQKVLEKYNFSEIEKNKKIAERNQKYIDFLYQKLHTK